jgi:hypothetical protein
MVTAWWRGRAAMTGTGALIEVVVRGEEEVNSLMDRLKP